MKITIRISGSLLNDQPAVSHLAGPISRLAKDGHRLIVVHGGNRFVTDELKRLAIPDRFEGGLRIVDRATRDIAVQVLAGRVSKWLSSAISREGSKAAVISHTSAKCFRTELVARESEVGRLGYEGYLTGLNRNFFEALWSQGVVLVAPPLARAASGEIYCINPDHMAAACAEYLAADKLLILPGQDLLPFSTSDFTSLTRARIAALLNHPMTCDRTVVKLEAAKRALEAGVESVMIVNPSDKDALLCAAFADSSGAACATGFQLSSTLLQARADV